MKEKFIQIVFNYKFLFIAYIVFALFASNQTYFLPKSWFTNGHFYAHYNNYLIFKHSFFHLIDYKDLYILYPNEHWDYYKYSPSFALLFAPFTLLPDYFGLILWNLLNAFVLFFAIYSFPKINDRSKQYILIFMLIELMTSMQNSQSNGLIAGLIILSFALLENEKYFLATLFLVFCVYIKLFGIVAFSLLLLYPKKTKVIGYSAFWVLIIGILPYFVISFHQLTFLYSSWIGLLKADHSISYGYSVMGWLKTWFGADFPKMYVVLAGAVLFCIPLFRVKLYKEFSFRALLLSSILIWIVIFNHKAESPTFIIAISGCAFWYFPRVRTIENLILIILVFIFTSLSPTDIFPREIRIGIFQHYAIKAVPCILIWLKLIYEMIFGPIRLYKDQIII